MESKVMTITPNIAREMLARNMKNNRKMSHDTVMRYARIMKSGGWNLTHQGIAFDENGDLIDGQQRLQAIIEANMPIDMMVTRGVHHKDGEAFTIDMGRKRTTLNIMQISGITDDLYKDMSNIVAGYIRHKLHISKAQPEPSEVIAYIDKHYDDLAQFYADVYVLATKAHGKSSMGYKKLNAFVGVALLSAFYRGEDTAALRKFVQVYTKNDVSFCEDYNPRHALNLRDYMRNSARTAETLQRCECAIYAFCHGQQKLTLCERYPVNHALDD